MLYGRLPTDISKDEVPGMPGETWCAINAAASAGYRSLTEGKTLSVILSPLKEGLKLSKN